MKNFLSHVFSTFGLLLVASIAYANTTNLSTYYPSPSGNYTKIHLINQGTGGSNENTTGLNACFCAQYPGNPSGILGGVCDTGRAFVTYPNAGIIFADSSAGYLEICKSDGTVASYPGSCFNRFGIVVASPACPNNYAEVDSTNQSFNTGGALLKHGPAVLPARATL